MTVSWQCHLPMRNVVLWHCFIMNKNHDQYRYTQSCCLHFNACKEKYKIDKSVRLFVLYYVQRMMKYIMISLRVTVHFVSNEETMLLEVELFDLKNYVHKSITFLNKFRENQSFSILSRIKVARARTRRKNTFPINTFKTLIYRSNWQDVSKILFLFHQNLWNNTRYQKIRSILHFVSMDTKWDSPW